MLTLQRASAGSGKTYSLTRIYLWLLLTEEVPESGRRRLRTGPELIDSARHILAITFTNKATNEMKSRIVDRLAELAAMGDSGDATYADEFMERLGVSRKELSDTSSKALNALLFNYSDFNVSTIDSFFQTVLRNFAYESNLNDSYGLELEDSEVIKSAFADVLQQLNSESASPDTRYWLSLLMDNYREKSRAWNIFMEGAAESRVTLLASLIRTATAMEKEEFKEIREKIDNWFGENPDLVGIYARLREFYEGEPRRLEEEMRRKSAAFLGRLSETGVEADAELANNMPSRFKKMTAGNFDFKMSKIPGSVLRKGSSLAGTPEGDSLDDEGLDICRSFIEYSECISSESYRLWKIYSLRIPYLAVIQSLRSNMNDLLSDANMLQLSETNSILSTIIGKDDTPFVYEKIGTRLNHLLIDEFQDTSRLQWKNLAPLLMETGGRGQDNLLIGDAKQSIYRFRNADSTLISQVVPAAFSDIEVTGSSRAENTNHRSDRRVVEFNNLVFGTVPASLEGDIPSLYGNAIQWPAHRDETGYVEVRKLTDKGWKGEETDRYKPYMAEMGPLVSSILKRGYRQKDIAFLVSSHSEGSALIDALMDYNLKVPAGEPKIGFISEDSLRISSSRGVGIIISALENMSDPPAESRMKMKGASESGREKFSWRMMKTAFGFFALRHPELEPHLQLKRFIEEGAFANPMKDLLDGMRSFSLPALIEEIIVNFVPEKLRDDDAVFIAGFQDLVLEFCENSAPDVASFLTWWNATGVSRGISTPESADAVRIVTIHKSKGLEYPCVIIPAADFTLMTNNKSEIRWVAPCLTDLPDGMSLPPFLPLEVSGKNLDGTPHASISLEYRSDYCRDTVNMAYVAFTRAVSELYLFGRGGNNTLFGCMSDSLANYKEGVLPDAAGGKLDYLPDSEDLLLTIPDEEKGDIRDGEAGIEEGVEPLSRTLLTFGEKDPDVALTRERKRKEKEEKEKKNGEPRKAGEEAVARKTMTEYKVTRGPETLFAVPASDTSATSDVDGENPDNEYPEDSRSDVPVIPGLGMDSEDVRAEGNLLHAILQNVKREEDIDGAIMRKVVSGEISRGRYEELRAMFRDAFASVREYGWFSGDMEVLNERSLFMGKGVKKKRPDRIMIDRSARSAVVVDYKFGHVLDPARYRGQLRGYVKALKQTGLFDSVEAWLWFVSLGEVIKIN